MLTEHLITYALDENNRPVNIDDVPRGIACNCTCAACGERLIAKKGDVKIHHFAHVSGADCVHGVQTSLHLAAKEHISENLFLRLPRLTIRFSEHHIIPIEAARNLRADKIELEKRIGDVVPDIVIYSGSKIYLVEIFVTHQVDNEKLEKLRKIGLPTLEIDLSDVNRENFQESLFKRISKENPYVNWIYHPLYEKYKQMFDDECMPHNFYGRSVVGCPRVFSAYNVNIGYCYNCKYFIRKIQWSSLVYCTGDRRISQPIDFTEERQKKIQARIQSEKKEFFRQMELKAARENYLENVRTLEALVNRLNIAVRKTIKDKAFHLDWLTVRLEGGLNKAQELDEKRKKEEREAEEKRRQEEEAAERDRIWKNRINEFVGKYSTVVCPICKKHMRLMYDGYDWEYYLGCSSKPSCGTKQEMCPKCGHDLWFRDDEEGFRMTCDNPECDYSVEFPDNQEQFNEYEQITFFYEILD